MSIERLSYLLMCTLIIKFNSIQFNKYLPINHSALNRLIHPIIIFCVHVLSWSARSYLIQWLLLQHKHNKFIELAVSTKAIYSSVTLSLKLRRVNLRSVLTIHKVSRSWLDGWPPGKWIKCLGRCLAWDATCPDTFATCHVTACSDEAGSAEANAEIRKGHKYQDIICGGGQRNVWCMGQTSHWSDQGDRLSNRRHHVRQSGDIIPSTALQSPLSEEMQPAFLGHCPKRALSTSRPIPVTDRT